MQDGLEVFSRRMRKAIPAEMIQLNIPASKLSSQGGLTVMAVCKNANGNKELPAS